MEAYIKPEMEVIELEKDETILTSGCSGCNGPSDCSDGDS